MVVLPPRLVVQDAIRKQAEKTSKQRFSVMSLPLMPMLCREEVYSSKGLEKRDSAATPYPGGFKCFTCEKAADNYECNRWAPDIYCPRDTRYCYTQHTMEVTGNSISVTKRCVPLEECLSTGCRDSEHEGHK
ncbi:hypothetical protein STEG23_001479, partial [Scotinomys teguina]